MQQSLRDDAERIMRGSLRQVLPDEAVRRELKGFVPSKGKNVLVAVGKAAWRMAAAAAEAPFRIDEGIVITKYGHVEKKLCGIRCFEAGHPIPDENGFQATEEVLRLVSDLTGQDTVLFLLSGGGSALFEKPLVSKTELKDITGQLMACGADIVEINTIRKRLSAVKGGRFAKACAPARVFSIVLSDILGDPLDMIASGPAYPDASTCDEALEIADRYRLRLSEAAKELLRKETPKALDNITTVVTGSVSRLCLAAAKECKSLDNVCLFSFGSDGTDGPTDAAGGFVDSNSGERLSELGIDIEKVLSDNDSYRALSQIDGLLVTGPTGTNVNDVSIGLIRAETPYRAV